MVSEQWRHRDDDDALLVKALKMEAASPMFLWIVGYLPTSLHGVTTSNNIVIFTAVRDSDLRRYRDSRMGHNKQRNNYLNKNAFSVYVRQRPERWMDLGRNNCQEKMGVNCDVLQNEWKLASNQSATDNVQILSDVKQTVISTSNRCQLSHIYFV